MTRIAIAYHSLTGTTHRIAQTMADALTDKGHEVRLRRIPEITGGAGVDRPGAVEHAERRAKIDEVNLADLIWAEGLVLGCPTRFGLPSAELLRFIDTTAQLSIDGALEFKAVSAFTSACATNGGQVSTLLSIHNAVGHWGAVAVTTGSVEPVLLRPDNGNPYGVGNISRNVPGGVPDDTLKAAAFLARRTASVAAALSPLQEHDESITRKAS